MEQMNYLPEYFAIENNGYYIYQTCIYNSKCILWPVSDSILGTLSYFRPDTLERNTYIQKWNNFTSVPCTWSHIGCEIDITKLNGRRLCIPVLSISDMWNLPYNNYKKEPCYSITDYLCKRRGTDTPARVWTTDPVASVPEIQSLLSFSSHSLPVAPVVDYRIPPHVKKLLITDAINRKEVCPISSDEITEANASVTSCGHIFIETHIKSWLTMESSKGLCPNCRTPCTLL